MIKWAVAGFVAGLVIMISTFTSNLLIGLLGFGIMLACTLAIEHHVRKLGRAGMESLTGTMRNGAMKNAFGNASKKWRDRWGNNEPPH